MDKLPQETFTSIISHLKFSDQLTCIRVCKRWNQIIGSTRLYRNVSFISRTGNYDSRFEQAYPVFNENEHFGQATTNLTLKNFEPQAFLILSLPRLFPNVQNLMWEDDDDDRQIDFPTSTFYASEFRKWQNITSIEAKSDFPIAAFILESSTFNNLTTLAIDFYTLDNRTSGYARSVLKNIKHAPALKSIELNTIQLDLHDMENLHNDAPYLEHVELFYANLKNPPADHNITITNNGRSLLNKEKKGFVQTTASRVKKFVFHLGNKPEDEILASWLLYPGLKYNNLEVISISCGKSSNVSSNHSDYGQPIANATSNMVNIKDYTTNFIPITTNILRSMDRNSVKLEALTLFVEDDNDVESQLTTLQSSSQVQHIKKLTMHTGVINNANPEIFGRAIKCLDNPYSRLVSISINFPSTHHGCLLSLLQNAPPVLETLEYFSIITYDDNVPVDTRGTPQLSNLKTLILTIGYHCNFKFENWNKALEAVVPLCPKLNNFELYEQGFIDYHDNLFILDLTPLRELKSVKIYFDNFDYYKFNQDDRLWEDYYNTSWNKTPSGDDLCVSLSWSGEPLINIKRMP